jgi:hypothetical protein
VAPLFPPLTSPRLPRHLDIYMLQPMQTEGPGMDLPPQKLQRVCWGNRPSSCVRHYVFRNLPTQTQRCPSLPVGLRTTLRKRGDLIVKNFLIVTPAHPEVTPRNWVIHVPKDLEKMWGSRPSDYSDEVRDTPRAYQLSVWR